MICVFVNCFSNSNENRIEPIKKIFDQKRMKTIYIGSNFDHLRKRHLKKNQSKILMINTLKYRKNLSIKRLYSHYNFSKKVYKQFLNIKPDFIYIKFPPNSLSYWAAKYKKKFPNTILVYDVFDMWPESLPVSKNIKKIGYLFFKIWRNIRNNSLKYADIVLSECKLFSNKLFPFHEKQIHTLYLTQNNTIKPSFYVRNLEKIVICYTGSINNIIDMDLIGKIIREISKYKLIKVNVIGGGENLEKFKEICLQSGAEFENHGFVYDEIRKYKIYESSHFGINIYKKNVKVGLTMKSIDYFKFGLPLLNNISYDTEHFINKYESGFNISNNNLIEIINKISSLTEKELFSLKKNARNVYLEHFTPIQRDKKINEIFKNILGSGTKK